MDFFKNDQTTTKQPPPDEKKDGEDTEQPPSVKPALRHFADITSLHTIPSINASTRLFARVIWIVVLVVATILFILHAFYLIYTFAQYETSSNVEVVFEKVVFPSVTFCNINPIRTSQVETYGSERLSTFLAAIEPSNNYGSYEPSTNTSGKRKKRETSEDYNYDSYVDKEDFFAPSGSITWDNYLDIVDDYDGIITDSTINDFSKTKLVFKELLADLPHQNRTEMGHRLIDMMLSCTYDGASCNAQQFTRFWDMEVGNCWTFNSASSGNPVLVSARSGVSYGLDMILYIEEDEYVNGLQLGRGIRVDIHPYQTMPFVTESGMSVAPGQQAYISLQMLNQTRLGGRYGKCNDSGEYVTYYGNQYRYTLEGCLNTCEDRSIASDCNCYRRTRPGFYNSTDLNRLNYCQTEEERNCVRGITDSYKEGSLNCGCYQACSTTDFQTTLSFDKWPDDDLWFSLVESVCVRDTTSCNSLQGISESDRELILQKNFLHLKLFYQDLNVHRITEMASYGAVQFGSDLGGTFGLWLGASIITIVELVDLCVRLCHFCYKKKQYNKGRSSHL